MTKTEKTILRLEQIIHHLETNGKYLEDAFLQEAVEDIKSGADRLKMALKDLYETRDCESCVYNIEPIPHICVDCSHSKDYYPKWKWRGAK